MLVAAFWCNVLLSVTWKIFLVFAAMNRNVLSCSGYSLCSIQHTDKYGACGVTVVCKILLKWKRVYIGQTGHGWNIRLREHERTLNNDKLSSLSVQTLICPSHCLFNESWILSWRHHQNTREIVERAHIVEMSDKCLSPPSVSVTNLEVEYLDVTSRRVCSCPSYVT